MQKYLIVVEKTKTGFSAYSPDLPGCVAPSNTKKSVEKEMRKAVQFHLQGLKKEGFSIPRPHSYSAYLAVAA